MQKSTPESKKFDIFSGRTLQKVLGSAALQLISTTNKHFHFLDHKILSWKQGNPQEPTDIRDEMGVLSKKTDGPGRKRRKVSLLKLIGPVHKGTALAWFASPQQITTLQAILQIKSDLEKYKLDNSLTPDEVIDFLSKKTFEGFNEKLKGFLLTTCILPEITIGMAEELTELPDAAGIIDYCLHADLVIPLQHRSAPAYAYTPSFKLFLQSEAKKRYSASEFSCLCTQAATLFEKEGRFDRAIELFEQAGDWNAAARLIREHALSILSEGKEGFLKNFLKRVPNDFLSQNVWLQYWLGFCLLPEDPQRSRYLLESALSGFQSQDETLGSLLAGAGLIESSLLTSGLSPEAQSQADRLRGFLRSEDTRCPAPDAEALLIAPLLIFASLFSADALSDGFLRERAGSLLKAAIPPFPKLKLSASLAIHFVLRGESAQAHDLIRRSQALVRSPAAAPSIKGLAAIGKGLCQLISGHPSLCHNSLQSKLGPFRKQRLSTYHRLSYILCIASSLACGKQRSFNLQFAEWERSANQTFAWERPVQLFINALFLKTNQKADLALAAIGDALQPTANLLIPFLEALIQLAKSTLVFSQGKTQEAFKALEAAERIANELESDLLRFNALMARACMEIRRAPDPGANETLRAALSLGKRKDLFEVFFGDRQDLKELCIQALELEVETDYIYQFIKHFRMSSHGVPVHLDNWPWFLKVFTLGHFSVVKEGQVLKTGRKAQRKPLQLLRVLLAFGGIRVEEEQILDALWPEAEGDSAHRSFTITLHRLRKLLGGSKVVELRNGCVTLAKEFCWVDAWAFESLTAKAETLWKTAQTEVDITRAIDTSRKAMALYRGSFFFNPHAQPWSLVSRDRFRSKYTHLVSILGEHWQRCSCMDLAVECYQRSIEEDPIDEEPYGQLMKCYHRMGRNEKALAVYNRLCTFLSSALGIEPSPQMKKLKISIQNESTS